MCKLSQARIVAVLIIPLLQKSQRCAGHYFISARSSDELDTLEYVGGNTSTEPRVTKLQKAIEHNEA
jgi:hypothetical protein